jgi:hypothetical protein
MEAFKSEGRSLKRAVREKKLQKKRRFWFQFNRKLES